MNAITDFSADDSLVRLEALADLSGRLLERARALGASQAEVSCSEERGLNVNVRMGAVETVESTRDRSIGVTVYFGQRKGSASTADLREDSLDATVQQACAIARYTEDDVAAGLADADLMATDFPDLDAWHPWALDADHAVDLALACEAAGREFDARISNSDGTSVGSGESLSVYANSHGFFGRDRSTQHSIGCALIAGQGDDMQRDGWYSTALARDDLEAPVAIGRHAAERTLARMAPRSLATGEYPVLFAAEVARSLIGHLLGAVSGGALYRRASFLLDHAGKQVFPDWFAIDEQPLLRARPAFRGVRCRRRGHARIARWCAVACCSATCWAAIRHASSACRPRRTPAACTTCKVAANAGGFEELVRGLPRGLLVTELMGQGVNPVTGDYSRGAAGFWIENGAIAYPVDGITIAGNLKDIFANIEAVGTDVDPRSHIACGSILVGR